MHNHQENRLFFDRLTYFVISFVKFTKIYTNWFEIQKTSEVVPGLLVIQIQIQAVWYDSWICLLGWALLFFTKLQTWLWLNALEIKTRKSEIWCSQIVCAYQSFVGVRMSWNPFWRNIFILIYAFFHEIFLQFWCDFEFND